MFIFDISDLEPSVVIKGCLSYMYIYNFTQEVQPWIRYYKKTLYLKLSYLKKILTYNLNNFPSEMLVLRILLYSSYHDKKSFVTSLNIMIIYLLPIFIVLITIIRVLL